MSTSLMPFQEVYGPELLPAHPALEIAHVGVLGAVLFQHHWAEETFTAELA